MLHSLVAPGHLARGLPADRRARPRRRCSPRPSPTPSRRCAARPCSPRSSRPRASSPSDDDVLDALQADRRAREHDAREAARAPATRPGASTTLREDLASAPGDRPDRRAARSRSPSSRPRRARSCGRPSKADDARGRGAGARRSDRGLAAEVRGGTPEPVARLRPAGIRAREAKQSEDHEPTCPDGRRADLARRARVRHLQPPAQRAHRLPRHARGRPDRQPDRRPAAAPRVRGSRQGHLDLHQLARAARCTRAWRSTTRCSSSSPTCRRSASASRCRWARCCWPAARRASAWRCPTRRS